MNPTPDETIEKKVNRQWATRFVADLMVCRRNIQSYPQDHPAVINALQKTLATLNSRASEGVALQLGISRQGLLLHKEILNPELEKFREFADTLSSFGILVITFLQVLKAEELLSFCNLINRARDEVWEEGGIKHAFNSSGIMGVTIQAIDPSVFTLTDDLNRELLADPWDVFVRRLMGGCFSVSAERIMQLLTAMPQELAGEFSEMIRLIPEDAQQQLIKPMADFLMDMGARQLDEGLQEDLFAKIALFIGGMPPDLRGKFILNICKASDSMAGVSEELLQHIPGNAFLEAMQYVASHGGNMPDMLLRLMERLSSEAVSVPDLDAAINAPGGAERVRVILRESAVEKYVPPAYQKALMSIISTDTLPGKSLEELTELEKTLDFNHLEQKTGDIIYEIVQRLPVAERGAGVRNNLMGLASHHLMNGDFKSLEKTCRIIIEEGNETESTALFDPGFIQEVLDAASLLGRDKFQEIRSIISTVGEPFVVPMMERLFEEENRAMRRLWFDSLSDLGDMVRVAALERLGDERWFVVRNLIIMLRNFNDYEVQRQMRRLANHPNPKVSREAIKNLLSYGDASADRILLQELESDDQERKLMAVQIAEMSHEPKVTDRLLAIVEANNIRDYGLELKKAAVQSLASNGNPGVLPKLKEFLSTNRLLYPGKHAQLKQAIIRALPRFPADQAVPILEEIAATGGKALSPEAIEALKTVPGYMP
jgi:HEAT repeat protein